MASLHSLDDAADLRLEHQLADEMIALRELDQWPMADSECRSCGRLPNDNNWSRLPCTDCGLGERPSESRR
jgi:hypothetical protein